jgi:hypothetical protein
MMTAYEEFMVKSAERQEAHLAQLVEGLKLMADSLATFMEWWMEEEPPKDPQDLMKPDWDRLRGLLGE